MPEHAPDAALAIRGLHVYYGRSHAIQGVDLTLARGILSVVGRNGMGKTTLCNTVMGLTPAHGGSIRLGGQEIRGRAPNAIARLGVGYVPQGRRLWPSLSVDEHLRLAFRGDAHARWTVERVYEAFPRLAERRQHGGGQLSGGEQQMLAIGRGLLGNPRLLIMDEPTEGLAPVIVDQVEAMLTALAAEDAISVLVIEQNIGVATAVSESVAVMVNGRISRLMAARELAADRELQQRLLGVGRHADEDEAEEDPSRDAVAAAGAAPAPAPRVFEVRRQEGSRAPAGPAARPTRWGTLGRQPPVQAAAAPVRDGAADLPGAAAPGAPVAAVERIAMPRVDRPGQTALVVGTFDTKARELGFVRDCLRERGLKVRTVDVSTSGQRARADVSAVEVAASLPGGSTAVFSGDRGRSITAMAGAFERWITGQRDIGGVIAAGGSGGTSLVAPGFRALPVGVPKIIVSTVASGDVSRYVGPADIMMLHSVADIQGINAISGAVLRNGANALAGMIAGALETPRRDAAGERPAVGITMFGVTTTCVQALTRRLEASHDCVVFHATGTGGRCMEKLVDSGMLPALIDVTTTEIADLLVGGVFAADEDRLGAVARTRVPYVGSVGALDMVNFGPMDTLPAAFRNRRLHVHNPQVTLMRTTRDENAAIGAWLAERLNRMDGPVRFLLPEHGVSALDAPGQPFHDPEADNALFEAIERGLRSGGNRRLQRVPAHINEPRFVEALESAFLELNSTVRRRA